MATSGGVSLRPQLSTTRLNSFCGDLDSEVKSFPADGRIHVAESELAVWIILNHRQKVVVILGALSQCLYFFAQSMIPLLLPPEIIEKNIPYLYVGVTFAVFAFVVVILQPFESVIIPYLQTKFAFVSGVFLAGGCYILFGSLSFVDGTVEFVSLAVSIRFIEGIAYATLLAAGTTMMSIALGNAAEMGFAIATFSEGIGYALGPLVAGPLAKATDSAAPFMLSGSLLVLLSLAGFILLERQVTSSVPIKFRTISNLKRLVSNRNVTICMLLLLLTGFTWSMIEATLEPHLARLGRGLDVEGVMFGVGNAAYGLSAPFWGWLSRLRVNCPIIMLLLGPFLCGFGYVFLGPVPGLEQLDGDLGLDLGCLVLIRLGMSMSTVAASVIMIKCAEKKGLAGDAATFALITAMWNTPYNIGEVIGPLAGAQIFTELGFPTVALINTVLCFIVGSLFVVIAFWDIFRKYLPERFRSDSSDSSEAADENRELLEHSKPNANAVSNYESI